MHHLLEHGTKKRFCMMARSLNTFPFKLDDFMASFFDINEFFSLFLRPRYGNKGIFLRDC